MLLRDAAGEPVWPVACPEDDEALTRFAQAFGLKTRSVDAVASEFSGGRGKVVGLGSGTLVLARLYAHLTGRSFQSARTRRELEQADDIEVVVALQKELDSSLLEHLYVERNGPACGLIVADNLAKLGTQCLVRAAAARFATATESQRVEVYPTEPFAERSSPERVMLGNLATQKRVIKGLSESSGLLMLSTHSDGIDTQLGPDLVLCMNARASIDAPAELGPTCAATGQCYRLKAPVRELRAQSRIISPDRIVTRILLYHTCYGLFLSERLYHHEWDISTAFLNSPTIGSIVACWKLFVTSSFDLTRLADEIQAGVPLGVAVGSLNSREMRRRTGRVFCILGDPGIQLPDRREVRKETASAKPAASRAVAAGRPDAEMTDPLYLLRRILKSGAKDKERPEVSGHARRALAALRKLEKSLSGAQLIPPQTLETLQAAFFAYLTERTSVMDQWMPLAHFVTAVKGDPCWICKAPTERLIARFEHLSGADRVVTTCPRCGIISDSPISSEVRARLRGGRTQSFGFLPDANWRGVVQVAPRWPLPSYSCEWPSQRGGAPRRSFHVSPTKQPGIMAFRSIFVWKFEFAICGHHFLWT